MQQKFQEQAHFNGLAENYAAARPDYPAEIFESYLSDLADRFPGQVLNLLDVACGTGAVLKNLVSSVSETKCTGIDISQDMLNYVRSQWLATKPQLICGDAVDYLAFHPDQYHGITLGQAWRYFRKTRFVEVAASALKSGGELLILQNTRVGAGLAGAYDAAAETYIPGYSRTERAFDIAAEIGAQASNVFDISNRSIRWSRVMARQDWTALVRSSSLLNRAENVAGQSLWKELDAAFTENSKDGVAPLNYELQVVRAIKL